MPETLVNGYSNGHMPYDMEDGSTFLFTSESVGEGHPGQYFDMLPLNEEFQKWLPAAWQ